MFLEVSILADDSESGRHYNCTAHCYLNNNPQTSSLFDSLIHIVNEYSSSVYNMPDAEMLGILRVNKISRFLRSLGEGNTTDNKQ